SPDCVPDIRHGGVAVKLYRASYAIVLVFAAAAAAQAQSSISDASIEACMQPVTAQVAAWQAQGQSVVAIRRQLGTALVHCRAPQTPGRVANFIAAVNTDLARAAQQFLEGKLMYADYMAILADRNGKYARQRTDAAFRAALASGDSDGDLIPDSLDR